MKIDKIQEGIAWLMVILILVMSATGFILGLKLSKQTQDYVTQNELQVQFSGYDDLEEYLEEVFLADLVDDLEYELYEIKNRIEELENQEYQILYGEFIGINSYGDKSYHVILVNGIELETIGDKNYTFVMSEKVIVLILGGTLYSIPLREAN